MWPSFDSAKVEFDVCMFVCCFKVIEVRRGHKSQGHTGSTDSPSSNVFNYYLFSWLLSCVHQALCHDPRFWPVSSPSPSVLTLFRALLHPIACFPWEYPSPVITSHTEI